MNNELLDLLLLYDAGASISLAFTSKLLFISDSTANGTDEWVYLFAQALAAAHPTHSVNYQLWTAGTAGDTTANVTPVNGSYPSATSLQTGTTGATLTVWNASVAGHTELKWQRAVDWIALTSEITQPDMIFISLGHNSSATTLLFTQRYIAFVQSIADVWPSSRIVLIAQNPSLINNDQAMRQGVIAAHASAMSYEYINVHDAFINPDTSKKTELYVDNVHPNSAGSELWRDTVITALTTTPSFDATGQTTPSFDQTLTNLIVNGADPVTAFAGWTKAGNSVASEATIKETGSSSAKITVSANPAYLYVFLANPTSLRGQTLTFAVRAYLPRNKGLGANAVRLAISEATSTILSTGSVEPADSWHWITVTHTVSVDATSVSLFIYPDTDELTGTGNPEDIYIDRMSCVVGNLPGEA